MESKMPKLKTKSGAKKRFKVSATGKVISGQAGKRHGMIKRTNSQIRKLRGTRVISESDAVARPQDLPAERREPRSQSFPVSDFEGVSSWHALNAA
jgi:large subunit ribosomal protein L35